LAGSLVVFDIHPISLLSSTGNHFGEIIQKQ